MKLATYCLSSVVFFTYFSVVVLVRVSGEQTSYDKEEMIAELKVELAQSVGRVGKLENLLAASVDIIAELNGRLAATSESKPDAGKFISVA